MTCADRGFTLVELVLTLILVSILAALGIGLFSTKDSFVAKTVTDQIIAHARLAQQVALGRHVSDTSGNLIDTRLILSQSGNDLKLDVSQGNYASTQRIDAQTIAISWKTSGTTSCGDGTSLSSSAFILNFDQSADTVGNALICIQGQRDIAVCITRLGFAYEGVCES